AVAVDSVHGPRAVGGVDDVVDDGRRAGDGAGGLEPPEHAQVADGVRAESGFREIVARARRVVVVHGPVLRVGRDDLDAARNEAVFQFLHLQAWPCGRARAAPWGTGAPKLPLLSPLEEHGVLPGLRWNGCGSLPGAQTERPGWPWPVRG